MLSRLKLNEFSLFLDFSKRKYEIFYRDYSKGHYTDTVVPTTFDENVKNHTACYFT